MKRRIVHYSLRANRDFESIFGIVADATGVSRAFGYVQRIRTFCERLDYGSERGTPRDELRRGFVSSGSSAG
ncbi:type II toxin-antitoxin system RelE/ParE family toxin [Mesorhizobium sp. CN2-181]|uniref:type II toxin-antitoxin system RelE/ParE family toxin n=1 Tax=Mesorhizobium yinganensis TaxID=3157707 RepID=UPI0032B7EF00